MLIFCTFNEKKQGNKCKERALHIGVRERLRGEFHLLFDPRESPQGFGLSDSAEERKVHRGIAPC